MKSDDRVHRAPSGSEPIAVRLEACLPFRFQRHFDEHLQGPIANGRNAKGPRPAVRLRNVHPSDWLRSVAPKAQASGQPHPAFWRPAHHAIDAGCRPARVLLGHPADREPFCGCGANQELLQVRHMLLVPGRRGTVDPTLQSPHGSFRRSPINVGPRRLLPFAGLFGLHRLTSPAIQALHVFPTVETMAEVSTLSGRVSPRHRGPIRPITGRPSLAPPFLYPSAIPSLAVGIPPPRGDGTSGAYPVVQWREAGGGRLRPLVRRGTVPPWPMSALDEPTRMPFWLRPVSTFGRLMITDLDNGRSLAFSRPSSARPPPDWCSQIMAVVPGASHVGLLLRMSR